MEEAQQQSVVVVFCAFAFMYQQALGLPISSFGYAGTKVRRNDPDYESGSLVFYV
jgi:hypothetical protein